MALYHSAKGPNNYTVVGSPAIVDGIAGGFSANNYLTLPSASSLSIDTMEWNVKFTTGSSVIQDYTQYFLGYEAHGGMSVRVSSGYFQFTWLKKDIYAWEEKVSTYVLSPNTTYIAHMKFNNTAGTVNVSLKNSNGEILYSNTYSNTSGRLYGTPVMGMRGNSSSYPNNYFKGSIDLNETYIIVNGQPWFGNCPVEVKKHQLRGPVGYTVVGSPTIVDGILTNVDADNRVKIANLNLGSNSFEIASKVKFSQQTAPSYGVYGFPAKFLPIYIVNRTSFVVYIRENSADNWSTITLPASMTPQVDIWYWWKVKHDGNGNYTFSVSTDEQNWVSATSSLGVINLSAEDFLIGRASSGNAGAIDLNETYVKVNGKLWYWQPQETKTIIVNGITVFNKGGNADYIIDNGQLIAANKNLYLESSGAQYIDTGVYGTDLTDYDLTWQATDTTNAFQTILGARENSSSIDRRLSVLTGDDTNRDTALYVTSRYTKTGNWEHTYTDLASLAKRNLKKVGNSVQLNGGATYTYSAPSTFTTPNTLKLFAMDTNGTVALYFSGKMYPCVIYENNVLVRNFVPVPQGLQIGAFTVPSNGMFDIVNQQFYANQGTGTFTIGKDE